MDRCFAYKYFKHTTKINVIVHHFRYFTMCVTSHCGYFVNKFFVMLYECRPLVNSLTTYNNEFACRY